MLKNVCVKINIAPYQTYDTMVNVDEPDKRILFTVRVALFLSLSFEEGGGSVEKRKLHGERARQRERERERKISGPELNWPHLSARFPPFYNREEGVRAAGA